MKRMSLLVLALLAFAALAACPASAWAPIADGSWTWQFPQPQGNALRAVDFADSSLGLSVGVDGAVIRTVDGGAHWSSLRAGDGSEEFNDVAFDGAGRAWITGVDVELKAPLLMASEDSGATWHRDDPGFADGSLQTIACGPLGAWAIGTGPSHGTAVLIRKGVASWQTINTGGPSAHFLDTATADGLSGWVVGYDRSSDGHRVPLILRTLDGGLTWSRQNAGFGNGSITSVAMTDAAHGWAQGTKTRGSSSRPVLMRTVDGGRTWAHGLIHVGLLAGLSFADNMHGYGFTSGWDTPNEVFATSDGGRSWHVVGTVDLGSEQYLNGCCFRAPGKGWIVGDGGYVGQTSDGGQTWLRQAGTTDYSQSNWSASLAVLDSRHVWAIAGLAVFHTVDGGTAWTRAPLDRFKVDMLDGLSFPDDQNGWIVARFGYRQAQGLLHTADGGATWRREPVDLPPDAWIDGAQFVSPSTGWVSYSDLLSQSPAIGIAKTTDGGATWTPQTVDIAKARLYDAFFSGPDDGWAVASVAGTSLLLATSDGGASWAPTANSPAVSFSPRTVGFLDDEHGWLTGVDRLTRSRAMMRTVDGGATWSRCEVPAGLDWLSRPRFSDPLNGSVDCGWYEGSDSPLDWYGDAVLRTTDGGQTWSGAVMGASAASFADADKGWAITSEGGIVTTAGGGWAVVDTTPPHIWSDWDGDVRSGWRHRTTVVNLHAVDMGSSGLESLNSSLDGAAFTHEATAVVAAPADHSNDGIHTVDYFATDKAGNPTKQRRISVRIDTRPPTARIARLTRVVGGSPARISFTISDLEPCGDRGTAMLAIRAHDGRLVKTLSWRPCSIGKAQVRAFRCTLPDGTYTVEISARDTALNRTKRPSVGSLIVR